MKTKGLNLTQARVRNLPIPEAHWTTRKNGNRSLVETRVIYYDAQTPGFGIRLSSGGTRSFVLYRKIAGRPQTVTLGRFPALSVERARKIAEEMNGAIARGENPQETKRARKAEATLGELFTVYLEQHAKLHTKTWQATQARYDRHLKPWENRKISAVTRRDVQALHNRMGQTNGPYSANRLLQLLHSMFNWAKTWGLLAGDNSAHGIKKYRETKRDRFLHPDELPRFFQALAEEINESVRDYVLLSLLTGARRGNVQALRWEEVNLERATWTIPGDKSKNYDPMTIPLHNEALAILQSRREEIGKSPWVFPAFSRSGHLEEPKNGWKRIITRAGIKDLRLHDLRRTLGSYQAARGASLTVIGKSLGHRNVSTTAIYARLNLDPVRESVNGAINDILAAGGVKTTAEVVLLKKRS